MVTDRGWNPPSAAMGVSADAKFIFTDTSLKSVREEPSRWVLFADKGQDRGCLWHGGKGEASQWNEQPGGLSGSLKKWLSRYQRTAGEAAPPRPATLAREGGRRHARSRWARRGKAAVGGGPPRSRRGGAGPQWVGIVPGRGGGASSLPLTRAVRSFRASRLRSAVRSRGQQGAGSPRRTDPPSERAGFSACLKYWGWSTCALPEEEKGGEGAAAEVETGPGVLEWGL